MDASAYRWMVKTVYQNLWRVPPWYEPDDLIQDGQWHYLRIRNKYPQISDPPYIMALFKRTFINHIHDLSKLKTKQPDSPVSNHVEDDGPNFFDSIIGDGPELSEFNARLARAPEPVLSVIRLLSTDDGCKKLKALRRFRNGRMENENQWLCRLVGHNPKELDLSGMVRSFLSPAV